MHDKCEYHSNNCEDKRKNATCQFLSTLIAGKQVDRTGLRVSE
ncbi:hypothetical protein NiCM35_23720 [Niallia circulans]